MLIPLKDIEQGIRRNFILSKEGRKKLDADYETEGHFVGAARMVFVGVSVQCGHRMAEICDYLVMSTYEFNGKLKKFKDYFRLGEQKSKVIKTESNNEEVEYSKETASDFSLRIYRKAVLVNNYLRLLVYQNMVA